MHRKKTYANKPNREVTHDEELCVDTHISNAVKEPCFLKKREGQTVDMINYWPKSVISKLHFCPLID